MPADELNLETLEKLSKNPNYKLSDKQVARLNQLRAEKYKHLSYKHDQEIPKTIQPVEKHDTGLNNGKDKEDGK